LYFPGEPQACRTGRRFSSILDILASLCLFHFHHYAIDFPAQLGFVAATPNFARHDGRNVDIAESRRPELLVQSAREARHERLRRTIQDLEKNAHLRRRRNIDNETPRRTASIRQGRKKRFSQVEHESYIVIYNAIDLYRSGRRERLEVLLENIAETADVIQQNADGKLA
jgi:hypothetical protein